MQCHKFGGILTLSQFLDRAQYGKFGYHETHSRHGKTDTYRRWGEPIVKLCAVYNISNVLEIGYGDGELGREILKNSQTQISWTGLERGDKIEKVKIENKTLVLFSYCLDSFSPECFVNDKMIGISVKNGILQEVLLDPAKIDPHISFPRLLHNQRLYFSLQAYNYVIKIVKKLPRGSAMLFIEELRPPAEPLDPHFSGIPRDLYAGSKDCLDIVKFYIQAGEKLYYYPLYRENFLRFIKTIGLKIEKFGPENKVANEISNKNYFSIRATPWTWAIVGKVV